MKSIKGFQTNNVQNIREKKIYVFGSKSTQHEKILFHFLFKL